MELEYTISFNLHPNMEGEKIYNGRKTEDTKGQSPGFTQIGFG